MIEYILSAENLSKSYAIDDRQVAVLNDVSISINTGEFVVIAGSSGSGKTTLLTLLSGLDKPSSGKIFFNNQDITNYSEDDLAPLRNKYTGFVFQSFHLIPSLTAQENIMFPAEIKKDSSAQQKAEKLLKRVNLFERRHNFPHQLSGGEKQRVAICRALINEPQLIFADEPTGNLDSENSRAILKLLMELHREKQTTLVLATHSKSISDQADRIIYIHDGSLQESSSDATHSTS